MKHAVRTEGSVRQRSFVGDHHIDPNVKGAIYEDLAHCKTYDDLVDVLCEVQAMVRATVRPVMKRWCACLPEIKCLSCMEKQ